jgi:hypothetical protein
MSGLAACAKAAELQNTTAAATRKKHAKGIEMPILLSRIFFVSCIIIARKKT